MIGDSGAAGNDGVVLMVNASGFGAELVDRSCTSIKAPASTARATPTPIVNNAVVRPPKSRMVRLPSSTSSITTLSRERGASMSDPRGTGVMSRN